MLILTTHFCCFCTKICSRCAIRKYTKSQQANGQYSCCCGCCCCRLHTRYSNEEKNRSELMVIITICSAFDSMEWSNWIAFGVYGSVERVNHFFRCNVITIGSSCSESTEIVFVPFEHCTVWSAQVQWKIEKCLDGNDRIIELFILCLESMACGHLH